jgi:hypothetical protein
VATSAANGGAVSTGDINSGGNVGNAIDVGDTWCGAAAPADGGGYEAPAGGYEAPAGGEAVYALPSTGVGFGDMGSLFALLGSAGAAAAAFGLRRR